MSRSRPPTPPAPSLYVVGLTQFENNKNQWQKLFLVSPYELFCFWIQILSLSGEGAKELKQPVYVVKNKVHHVGNKNRYNIFR